MTDRMELSIVIPTLNEEKQLGKLLSHLWQNSDRRLKEIIVADGQSVDNTCAEASKFPCKIVKTSERSRSKQMNLGAENSTGDILYFVHADTIPPDSYLDDIEKALQKGADLGCYRFRFNSDNFFLRFNSFMTRFDSLSCRGGDQTLFVKSSVFKSLNGYDEEFEIMEEYDFLKRAKKNFQFVIMPKDVVVSARKYENNSYLRVNFANAVVFSMFRMGFNSGKLKSTYYSLLNHRDDQ